MSNTNIPEELRSRKRWLIWKLTPTAGDGKPKKKPHCPSSGGPCSAGEAHSHLWSDYETAMLSAARFGATGVGYVFKAEDGLVGIDLDQCRRPESGALKPWAQEIVNRFRGFTEVSPSGTGVHIIVKGSLARSAKVNVPDGGAIEIYSDKRYFTVTGNILLGRNELHHEQEAVDFVLQRMADYRSLDRLFRGKNGANARRLWDGDLNPCDGDHSKADFQLLCLLREATNGDREVTERLFGESQLGQRDKWTDRDDYRERTLDKIFPAEGFLVGEDDGGVDNDHSHARALIDVFEGRVCYDHNFGNWRYFDEGHGWQIDDHEMKMQLSLEAEKRVLAELAKYTGTSRGVRDRPIARVKAYGTTKRIESALALVKADPAIARRASDFDRDPHLFGTGNGAVDLRTGEFRPHCLSHLIIRRSGVVYDPDATAPRWEQFLEEVACEDQALIEYLQRLVGYSLTGETSEQCFFFLYGHGANGKSTFIETIQEVLGKYARRSTDGLIYTSHNGREPQQELASLCGARLVIGQESGEGRKLNEGLIKGITGGDTITARKLYCEQFDYKPVCKIWLYGNHKPRIDGSDDGIWRRVRLIPFAASFPDEKQDKALPRTLRGELPGILNWAIEGSRLWYTDGLETPERIADATRQYRQDSDWLGEFIAEEIEDAPEATVLKAQLYRAYQAWAEDAGYKHPLTKNALGRRLSERGYENGRNSAGHYWKGIALRTQATSFVRAA